MGAFVLDDARKQYGDVSALDGVDFRVGRGTVHGLAGPNGSGKTTMLRLLAGLSRPTGGEVRRPDASVGCAFQQPNVYPDLSVGENLDVFATLVGADDEWRTRLADVLRLDPALHREAAALSDGYAKKLDLALALLKRPDLLLLDEPLADLDDLTVRQFLAFLAEYAGPERAVVVSSHNLGRFADLLDALTVVLDGRVVARRSGDDLADPAEVYDAVLAGETG